ncbi:unnamed protein product [Thelazia callipaeda]|uniref:WD_REPEATS_REGION domain-containing protein n=1 Tax=Thelazia callipaeda TaxID=103827 RepID=A0A0N5D722_THECL|nr:unnamed protein product [Thelazia callipaeda]
MFRRILGAIPCKTNMHHEIDGTEEKHQESEESPVTLLQVRIILFFPSLEEFECEHRVLLDEVIPHIQQYAAQTGIDIEFVEPLTDSLDTDTTETILNLFSKPTSYLLVSILWKHCNKLIDHNVSWEIGMGNVSYPRKYQQKYFAQSKQAFRKQAMEAESVHYQLRDTAIKFTDQIRLISILHQNPNQQCEKQNYITKTTDFEMSKNDERNKSKVEDNLLLSATDRIVRMALTQPKKVVFCLRNMEAPKEEATTNEASVVSIRSRSKNENVESWQITQSHIKYTNSLVTDHLLQLLYALDPPRGLPSDVPSLVKAEHNAHVMFAKMQMPKKWLSRVSIDETLRFWTEQNTGYYHIQGSEASGKTALICRLHAVLVEKHCYVITRFVNLTPESQYAHELWHGICLTLCFLMGENDDSVINSFHLSSTLAIFKFLLQKLDRPVFVLIDDVNNIRYGRILSVLEESFQKCPDNLVLICSSVYSMPLPFMPQPIRFILPNFTTEDIAHYISLNTAENTLNQKQLNDILDMVKLKNNSIIIVQLLLKQIISGMNRPLVADINEWLNGVENNLGIVLVRLFAQFLTVAPHGITSLELLDALMINSELQNEIPDHLSLSILLHLVIDKLGCFMMELVHENRLVYKWSHVYIANIIRHRYLSNTVELEKIHSLLADLYADLATCSDDSMSARPTIIFIYPRPLKRDDGTVNRRKIHNLWYHLLHAGNMDALKKFALCHFDYVEACVHACGLLHLLSIYEECSLQALHHDIQVVCEQFILPSLNTIVRDRNQLAAEVISRLYTQAESSQFLNTMVEQAVIWVDMFAAQPLLIPLTSWIPPERIKQVLSFTLPDWQSSYTILHPTHNHQHLLISGNESSIGLVYMFHTASQLLVRTYAGHEGRVTSISVSSNGMFFATTSTDCTVRIWNFAQNHCAHVLQPHKGRVVCSLISSDCKYLITGGTDSCANVISVENWQVTQSFKGHTGTVVSLALTSSNEFLVTGSGEFVVMIWNLLTGTLAVRLAGLMAPVSCMTITSNDAFVAVACEDETLRIFETVSGQELHEVSGHDGKIIAMIAASDDCQLFAATIAKIYIFDIHSGRLLDILSCVNKQPVTSLQITSDGFFLLSACGDRISIWNIQNRHIELKLSNHEQEIITDICMSSDEKSVACSTSNGIITLWDLNTCQCISTMVQKQAIRVNCLKFSADCEFLLSGDTEGQINVWNSGDGKLIRLVNHHSKAIVSIFCLSDGSRILSADKSNIILIWNLFLVDETLEADRILTFTGIQPPVFLLAKSSHLIGHFPNSNKELRIWGIEGESVITKARLYHNDEITCFSATTNGTLLATGSADLSLKLWQVQSGFLMQVLVGHEEAITCCAIASDESIVVSGAKDSRIMIWNVSTGNAQFSFKTDSLLTSLAITGDASVILSANSNGWIEAYDVENGILLSSLNAHSVAQNLIISMDANRILVQLTNCSRLPILCLHNTPAGIAQTRLTDHENTSDFTQSSSSQVSLENGGNYSSGNQLDLMEIGNAESARKTPLFKSSSYANCNMRSPASNDSEKELALIASQSNSEMKPVVSTENTHT